MGRHPVYAKNQVLPLPDDSPITSRLPESALRLEARDRAKRAPKIHLPVVDS
jgi:hypothetical protein